MTQSLIKRAACHFMRILNGNTSANRWPNNLKCVPFYVCARWQSFGVVWLWHVKKTTLSEQFQNLISKSYKDEESIRSTQIHVSSLSWLVTGIPITNGEVKLVLLHQTSLFSEKQKYNRAPKLKDVFTFLSVTDEGYFRNASEACNLISTFSLLYFHNLAVKKYNTKML